MWCVSNARALSASAATRSQDPGLASFLMQRARLTYRAAFPGSKVIACANNSPCTIRKGADTCHKQLAGHIKCAPPLCTALKRLRSAASQRADSPQHEAPQQPSSVLLLEPCRAPLVLHCSGRARAALHDCCKCSPAECRQALPITPRRY